MAKYLVTFKDFGPKKMNPRAWIVTKQGMTGDLYEALAWDNGGKPLGVSCTPPIPLYEAMPVQHSRCNGSDSYPP